MIAQILTAQQVAQAQAKLGRKFEVQDVDNLLMETAVEYAVNYAGNFQFMVEMRQSATVKHGLSVGQAKAVLNCMAADGRYQEKNSVAKQVVTDPETVTAVQQEPQMQGTFTLILDPETDDRVTLRLKNMDPEQLAKYNRLAGSQVIEYMCGPDNETQYRGFGFVTGRDVKIWKKFEGDLRDRLEIASQMLMDADTETLKAAGYEWALVSGRCWVCGHKLTVPASICNGIGPVCADKF